MRITTGGWWDAGGIFVFIIVGGHRCKGQRTTYPLSHRFWGLDSGQQTCVESALPAEPSQGVVCLSVCPLPHCAAYECVVSSFANAPRGQRPEADASALLCHHQSYSLESWSLTEPGRVWQPESPTNSHALVTSAVSY